jgi:probable phosphoglycerate mutase
MSESPVAIYLARHGETEWSLAHKHTGRTDIPLTARGETNARALAPRLKGISFAKVLSSPLQRAKRTCELAGLGAVAVEDADLMEWDYGSYEGRKTSDIRQERPDWDLFRDGCPQGESVADVSARADRVVAQLRSLGNPIIVFSHGHFLRVLTARWLGLEASAGRCLMLDAGALSILGYEHVHCDPVIRLWNECGSAG